MRASAAIASFAPLAPRSWTSAERKVPFRTSAAPYQTTSMP